MNILITAGGTSEKLDEVRYLTNHATGKLGKQIAEACLQFPDLHVYYVHGQQAVLPKTHSRLHLFPIHSVNELKLQLESLLTTHPFFAVIHSMAVSDYYVEKTFSEIQLIRAITDQLQTIDSQKEIAQSVQAALHSIKNDHEKKISSANDYLYVELKQAPKVISLIKKWQPTTKLVGFKLLVDVSQEQLIDVAYQQLQKNHCDFVLANDLTQVSSESHTGFLVDSQKNYTVYSTKMDIAQGILAHLFNDSSSSSK